MSLRQFLPTKSQCIVLFSIVLAMGSIAAWFYFGLKNFSFLKPTIYTEEDQIAYTLKWLMPCFFTLFLGILSVSLSRFHEPDFTNGDTPETVKSMIHIHRRYVQNTMEQLLLFSFALITFSISSPHELIILIPMFSILFCIGRITFWVGYLIHPLARGYGFALTFLPTMFLLMHNIIAFFPIFGEFEYF